MSSAHCITAYAYEIISGLEKDIKGDQGIDRFNYIDAMLDDSSLAKLSTQRIRNQVKAMRQRAAAAHSECTRNRLFLLIDHNASMAKLRQEF